MSKSIRIKGKESKSMGGSKGIFRFQAGIQWTDVCRGCSNL